MGVTDMVVATPLPWGPAKERRGDHRAPPGARRFPPHRRHRQIQPEAAGPRHVHERAVDDEEHHERGADRKRHAKDPLQRHVHVADDPVEVVPFVGNGAREVLPEIHIEQKPGYDQGEGGADDAAGDFQQQDDRHDADIEIHRLRDRGTADKCIRIDTGIGDGGHAQDRQEDVRPDRPVAGVFADRIDKVGEPEDEGHVDHAEEIGFHGPDRPIERPADEPDEESAYRYGRLALKLPHRSPRDNARARFRPPFAAIIPIAWDIATIFVRRERRTMCGRFTLFEPDGMMAFPCVVGRKDCLTTKR